jgi:hypothetical protein
MHSIFNFNVECQQKEKISWLPILELLCHSSEIVKNMNKSSLNIKNVKF